MVKTLKFTSVGHLMSELNEEAAVKKQDHGDDSSDDEDLKKEMLN